VIRVTMQALAAVLGGTQSLHTNSYDEAYALPSQQAVTIALRTQQIIAHESGVADTADPLAGSYCIEDLTNQIEEEATKYIDNIDRLGGAIAAVEKGYMQREIVESAYKLQQDVENKQKIIVGVNQFTTEEETPIETQKVDPAVEKRQVQRLRTLKRNRNNKKVDASLVKLCTAAEHDMNLMPVMIEALKEYATLGEICDILRQVYGEYRAPTVF